jgi:hypothetical protein
MVIPMTIGCCTIVVVGELLLWLVSELLADEVWLEELLPPLPAKARYATAIITMTRIMATTLTALLTALLNPRRGRSIDREQRPVALFRVLKE